ncbi:hypothetical protein SAMN05444680_11649 [Variovorax sp. YR216]|nr:hypothetical protein SAMN05444680_11649 [Variovorax sp. YR216]
MRVDVAPPVDVGRRGESRVIACIQAVLAREGRWVVLQSSIDARGEDAVLQVDGEPCLAVQIVTPALGNPAFWGTVARSRGAASGEIAEAIDWIHRAISDKAARYPKEDRRRMMLARPRPPRRALRCAFRRAVPNAPRRSRGAVRLRGCLARRPHRGPRLATGQQPVVARFRRGNGAHSQLWIKQKVTHCGRSSSDRPSVIAGRALRCARRRRFESETAMSKAAFPRGRWMTLWIRA